MKLHKKVDDRLFLSTVKQLATDDEALRKLKLGIDDIQNMMITKVNQKYTHYLNKVKNNEIKKELQQAAQNARDFEISINGLIAELNQNVKVSSIQTEFEIDAFDDDQRTCKLCKKTFSKLTRFEQHNATYHQKSHECQTCQLGFPSPFSLWVHDQIIHRRKYYTFDLKFLCIYCKQKFTDARIFQSHLEKNHWVRMNTLYKSKEITIS